MIGRIRNGCIEQAEFEPENRLKNAFDRSVTGRSFGVIPFVCTKRAYPRVGREGISGIAAIVDIAVIGKAGLEEARQLTALIEKAVREKMNDRTIIPGGASKAAWSGFDLPEAQGLLANLPDNRVATWPHRRINGLFEAN